MTETCTQPIIGSSLAAVFHTLRTQHRAEYHDALVRAFLSLALVLVLQQSSLMPHAAGDFATRIAVIYHLCSQMLFLHLLLRPDKRDKRIALGASIDVFTVVSLSYSGGLLALFLVPWLLWIARAAGPLQKEMLAGLERESIRRQAEQKAMLIAATHDLRAPLGGIIHAVDSLRNAGPVEPPQLELLKLLEASSRVVKTYADQIMDMSCLQDGELLLHTSSSDLRSRLNDIGDVGQAMALEKGLRFIRTFDDSLPAVWRGDGPRLDQILVNLLSNAVKFTDQGSIELKAEVNPGSHLLVLEVEDSGAGLTEAARNVIFLPYRQAQEHAGQHHLGYGLGLHISRKIVLAMGGELRVQSSPGKGAVFRVELPLAIRPEDSRALSPALLDRPPPGPRSTHSAGSILAIDDDPFMRRVFRLLELDLQASVDVAGSARQGLCYLSEKDYSAIILDLNLPDVGGMEFAHQLQKEASRTPIIIVSGDASAAAAIKNACASIHSVMPKPINRSRLVAELVAVLGRHD